MSDGNLLEAAEELARITGTEALRYFHSKLAVELKGDGSPVTVADRAAERRARDWLTDRFPNDGILGEEFGEHRPGAVRRWVIDPIDGTKSFVRGVPLWGSLVAVCEGVSVLAGAGFFPAVGEMLAAAPGRGCWWNGTRAAVSQQRDLAAATVLTTDERFAGDALRRDAWRRLADGALISRSWGDCYGYLMVATGRADVMVDPVLSSWDAAALMPAIMEAGGTFTDWSGAVTSFGGSAIATNKSLSATVREILGVPALD